MGGEKVQPTPETTPVRPEDEKLGLFANLAYGIQHILTMYGGIVAVPLIGVLAVAGQVALRAGGVARKLKDLVPSAVSAPKSDRAGQ